MRWQDEDVGVGHERGGVCYLTEKIEPGLCLGGANPLFQGLTLGAVSSHDKVVGPDVTNGLERLVDLDQGQWAFSLNEVTCEQDDACVGRKR